MKVVGPLIVVVLLAALAWCCTEYLHWYALFGIVIPYVAVVLLIVGLVVRIVRWARSAVPFRIPTTCGQQKSLPWIKQAKLDNPSSKAGVFGRMVLEVLTFRSLFRNNKVEKRDSKLGYTSAKWLFLGALLFHWSMLIIVIRHLRLALEPVPDFLVVLEQADGFLQVGLPLLYISDVLIVVGLVFLLARRLTIKKVRYISLSVDFFPLFLLLGIAISGIVMRYAFRVDIAGVKEVVLGLLTFHPVSPDQLSTILFVHLFLVCVLMVYFPWSKLMHAPGIFMSPTRNLANNSREVRHVNPWNYPVKVHTYAEYQEEYGEKMKSVGLPLDPEVVSTNG